MGQVFNLPNKRGKLKTCPTVCQEAWRTSLGPVSERRMRSAFVSSDFKHVHGRLPTVGSAIATREIPGCDVRRQIMGTTIIILLLGISATCTLVWWRRSQVVEIGEEVLHCWCE